MSRFILFIFAIGIAGCNVCNELKQNASRPSENCLSLMALESEVTGDLNVREQFHQELMFECRRPDLAPYARMNSLIDSMKTLRSEVISIRGFACAKADSVASDASLFNGKKVCRKLDTLYRGAEERLIRQKSVYFQHAFAYDSLVEVNSIQRITHSDYAVSLLIRLMAWEDSLELQGGMIMQNQGRLQSLGLEKNDPLYIEIYQPISQMQLLHKKMQSVMTSIESQQSRYDSARPEECFYLGPHLVERHDYLASEGRFEELVEIWEEFQSWQEKFREGLKPYQ